MAYILINALPILAATVAGLLFGVVWTRIPGRGGEERRLTVRLAITAFAAEFWLASILAGALILAPRQAGEWVMAIGTAVVIWVGFVVPSLAVTLSFRRHGPWAIIADCGYWLGAMVLQAIVLQAIGLAPPPIAP